MVVEKKTRGSLGCADKTGPHSIRVMPSDQKRRAPGPGDELADGENDPAEASERGRAWAMREETVPMQWEKTMAPMRATKMQTMRSS